LRSLDAEGAPSVFRTVVSMFLDDTPSRIEQLKSAVDRGDTKSIERVAHALKSSCGTVGADFLAELCATLEAKGRSEDREDLEGLVRLLDEEFSIVRLLLAREIEETPDSPPSAV